LGGLVIFSLGFDFVENRKLIRRIADITMLLLFSCRILYLVSEEGFQILYKWMPGTIEILKRLVWSPQSLDIFYGSAPSSSL
jgi:hypothetical protein